MAHTITLIPGDGIGPEVTAAVVRIFTAAGLQVEWDRQDAGVMAFKRFGQSLPAQLLESVKRNKVALKGPVTTTDQVSARRCGRVSSTVESCRCARVLRW